MIIKELQSEQKQYKKWKDRELSKKSFEVKIGKFLQSIYGWNYNDEYYIGEWKNKWFIWKLEDEDLIQVGESLENKEECFKKVFQLINIKHATIT